MEKAKWGITLLGIALIGALAWVFVFSKGPSDEELIRRALDESIEASKEGRPGSVLELLSKEFTVNEQRFGTLRDVARAVRDFRPNVEIVNRTAAVRGDTAVLITPVKLSVAGPIPLSVDIPEVRMEFMKENSVQWLIVPTKKWKLKHVKLTDESLRHLISLF